MAIRDMGVKQIERAIAQLPASELAELVSWLEDDHAQVWDMRIEQDLAARRLGSVLAESEEGVRGRLGPPALTHLTLPRLW